MLHRYYVYDFALPLLVLHALHWQTSMNLRRWMQICPRRQITVLDTHDGRLLTISSNAFCPCLTTNLLSTPDPSAGMGIDDITGLAEVSGR